MHERLRECLTQLLLTVMNVQSYRFVEHGHHLVFAQVCFAPPSHGVGHAIVALGLRLQAAYFLGVVRKESENLKAYCDCT